MSEQPDDFAEIVGALLRRFFVQNAQTPPDTEEIAGFTARLRSLITERGLPPPLTVGEIGAPGGMAETVCAPLVARVAGAGAPPLLTEAARQLVKACFYPEFTVCRDSYRESGADNVCRRQDLARVRGRISGTHCVDCPYWTALEPEAHARLLRRAWRASSQAFVDEQGIFLPEDFRALRRWLHATARRSA